MFDDWCEFWGFILLVVFWGCEFSFGWWSLFSLWLGGVCFVDSGGLFLCIVYISCFDCLAELVYLLVRMGLCC